MAEEDAFVGKVEGRGEDFVILPFDQGVFVVDATR